MPFPFWPFKRKPRNVSFTPTPITVPPKRSVKKTPRPHSDETTDGYSASRVRRHFYNEPRFQCYASFFSLWDGWITAGHCMTDARDHIPPFAKGPALSWPGGLDAALLGTTLPPSPPPAPKIGQRIIAQGFPAGSRHMEERRGHVYIERGTGSGQWIAHIEQPDEPVVTGMSGGVVIDADSKTPIGIIITRNSPADLNRDDDPDESFDFIALNDVWEAAQQAQNIS